MFEWLKQMFRNLLIIAYGIDDYEYIYGSGEESEWEDTLSRTSPIYRRQNEISAVSNK